jgi:hypothetical protein
LAGLHFWVTFSQTHLVTLLSTAGFENAAKGVLWKKRIQDEKKRMFTDAGNEEIYD